jgi:hypothetical protein
VSAVLTAAVIAAALIVGTPAGMVLGHLAGRLSRAHDHRRNVA